ncbi:MAG: hypothetical protein WBE30_05570 [Candidatus Cybelea sp.]|jgi:hypothetical protein
MPGVAMAIETLADEIRRHMWSGEQHRHFELGVAVRNETLTVDLKPYVQTIEVLYRLFERDEPLTDWLKTEITFKPFAPGL